MRKFGIAQIKNVLKIIKSKLGRFGQWLDEVYNPWMLRILVALTIAFVIFHVRNTIRTLTIEGYSRKIAWEYIGDSVIDIVYTFMLIVFIGSLFLLPFLYYLRKRYLRSLTSTSDMSSGSVEDDASQILVHPKLHNKKFKELFTKEFRGNRGQTIDYCTIIQSQLSDPTRKFSTRELCILSLALRETEGVVKDTQSPFSVWTLSFFDAIGIEPPKDKSPNKYKTSRNIAEEYNFSNFNVNK